MDKKFLGLVILFFLFFVLFITLVVFNEPLTQLTRAREGSAPSGSRSLILAFPLEKKIGVPPNDVNINVFVRSQTNKPVVNRKVTLRTTLGTIKEIRSQTDKTGKATFSLTSQVPGIAQISAVIDDSILITRKISVKFTE